MTVRNLADDPSLADAIALRHDIDHDLDLALEAAHHEHRLGLHATYYLLHTHEYWRDPDLVLKCRQLAAYGHEVGLHLNVLTEWFAGRCDDVDHAVRAALSPLREAGITITGTSSHGDRACYEKGFSNYWIWRELRGDDPTISQKGCSAEGVRVSDPKWQVPYPADHRLKREDGAELELWQSSLAAHGLKYDAMHVPIDQYWSDSGGKWQRSGDPLTRDLSRGRHLVLIHPYWWRGEKKQYFFLSTARSGSAWLSHVIDRATNCRGLHEFTFNHRFENDEPVPDKRTSDDFEALCRDRTTALSLLRQSLRWMRQQPGDVAEANVYLEPFLTELRELAPGAALIHLHRDGRDVVRSILNRGWYDNPDDHKHRAVPVKQWDELSRFERACWYWRYTNEAITPHATRRIGFESMVSDLDDLTRQLEELGVILHPLLAEHVFHEPRNVSKQTAVPPYDEWTEKYRRAFAEICGSMQRMLGYEVDAPAAPAASVAGTSRPEPASRTPRRVLDLDFASVPPPAVSVFHVQPQQTPDGLLLRPATINAESGNLVALLTTGKWNRVEPEHGVPCGGDVFYHCRFHAVAGEKMRARLFVLFYDSSGALIRQFQAGTIRSGESQREFSFAPALEATHLALALHMGRSLAAQRQNGGDDETLLVKRLQLESLPMDRRYAAMPEAEQVAATRSST